MQKLSIALALFTPMALLAGCTTLSSSVGPSAMNARLPTGVTLLDSDQNECGGIVQVEDESRSPDAELVIRRGQNATFDFDDEEEDDIEWSCIGESARSDSDEIDCPTGTSHVRITRPSEGEEFLLECYGRRTSR